MRASEMVSMISWIARYTSEMVTPGAEKVTVGVARGTVGVAMRGATGGPVRLMFVPRSPTCEQEEQPLHVAHVPLQLCVTRQQPRTRIVDGLIVCAFGLNGEGGQRVRERQSCYCWSRERTTRVSPWGWGDVCAVRKRDWVGVSDKERR